ncbi:CaiB/BaiF CoA transferase family protein [Sphingomonas sp. Leaf38]|uniref:CaiB/BaiF CoA transferase family protein n=1 Tax=Sphingomonas sp. Leaf38 TaxID=1736217 RepID=UPI0006F7A8EB|nr:CaiB/BaiF CoA-transferase family protein [Sphingomonas sp. Leaf38]KQN33582.1 carnitine dehydratase [Sphingomonas sp. Leaf38]
MTGPLAGIRIVELAGIGPAPFACMMLADHGAEVIRIERPGAKKGGPGGDPTKDILQRSRKTIAVDLKSAAGIGVVHNLVASADGFVEGFRPGVTERLGLGPETLLKVTPRLVYGRMTGWGQEGPYAQAAGHDINYIALAGALHAFGRAGDKPTPPINMVGDFGGGAMMLAFGMVSALLHARTTGQGQVIDCAMTDGTALLMSMIWSFQGQGLWRDERGVNLLDSGAHFYDTYVCADGTYVSIGAIEPQFYAVLREKSGLSAEPAFDRQMDPRGWPELKEKLSAVFATRTRDEWCAILEHTDACFAPVLSMAEAPAHPHNVARGTFVELGGVVQPMPAPRYSVTPTVAPRMANEQSDTEALLDGLGYAPDEIAALKAAGAVA